MTDPVRGSSPAGPPPARGGHLRIIPGGRADELPPGFAACLDCPWSADPAGELSPVLAAYEHAAASGHPVIARYRAGPAPVRLGSCPACGWPRYREHLCGSCWGRLSWTHRKAILTAEGRGRLHSPAAVVAAVSAAVAWLRAAP